MQNRLVGFLLFVVTIVATAAVTMLVTNKNTSVQHVATEGGLDKSAVEEVVRDFIVNNPEEVIQALMMARAKQEQEQAAAAEENISARIDDIENTKAAPSFGAENGDIVFVKFNDYNCGFCKRVAPDIAKLAESDPKITFVVREFPILGDASIKLARAALAFDALSPENYGEFHKQMLKSTPRTDDQIKAMAEKFGVNGDTLLAEMEKDEYTNQIRENLELGQSIGVQGTPAFVIGGEFVRGAIGVEQMKAIINGVRADS